MRALRTLIISTGVILAVAAPSLAVARPLIVGGSTSVLPLAEKLATAYHNATHQPRPKVKGGQSDVGVSEVCEGKFDVADVSRDPLAEGEPCKLKFVKIAHDALCIVTGKEDPISNLSQESVVNIFTGRYSDWSQVPGHRITGPIDLFDRDGASGTQDAFQHIFLEEGEKIAGRATPKTSNGQEQVTVGKDKQGIGFVSLAYTGGTNVVGYNGVACNLRNARSGQYLGVRNFWMAVKPNPSAQVVKFLAWVTSGKASVNRIINSNWLSIY